jgi:hypothetical protein
MPLISEAMDDGGWATQRRPLKADVGLDIGASHLGRVCYFSGGREAGNPYVGVHRT